MDQAYQTERAAQAGLASPEFVTGQRARVEELVAIQTQQMERLREIGGSWLARMQSEVTLASELSARLAAARTLPDVTSAYQEWIVRHMEAAAEDSKRVMAAAQTLADTEPSCFPGDGECSVARAA